jgi:hypothetical protein
MHQCPVSLYCAAQAHISYQHSCMFVVCVKLRPLCDITQESEVVNKRLWLSDMIVFYAFVTFNGLLSPKQVISKDYNMGCTYS